MKKKHANSLAAAPDISIIITVLNEAHSVERLLKALAQQTVSPREIVITDGGSTDGTYDLLKTLVKKNRLQHIQILQAPGTIGRGRNVACSHASGQWFAITDAGCVPEPTWLKELIIRQHQTQVPVVAGYYRGLPQTPFEEAVVPYVLVMPSRVDPNSFLPATRSVLLHRSVWEQLDGFDESLQVSEDYAFALEMQRRAIPMAFAQKAVVGWMPRQTLRQFARMIAHFAQGDIRAGTVRPKVVLVFLRYIIGALVAGWFWQHGMKDTTFGFMVIGVIAYSLWAIKKNVRYVSNGWYWLPVLQFTADAMVMGGTLQGLWYRFRRSL